MSTTVTPSELAIFSIRNRLINAASRNEYDTLKKADPESDQLDDLKKKYDVFCAKYMDKEAFFVFVKDGKCMQIGARRFNDMPEAIQHFVEKTKSSLEKGVKGSSAKTCVVTNCNTKKTFSEISKELLSEYRKNKREIAKTEKQKLKEEEKKRPRATVEKQDEKEPSKKKQKTQEEKPQKAPPAQKKEIDQKKKESNQKKKEQAKTPVPEKKTVTPKIKKSEEPKTPPVKKTETPKRVSNKKEQGKTVEKPKKKRGPVEIKEIPIHRKETRSNGKKPEPAAPKKKSTQTPKKK